MPIGGSSMYSNGYGKASPGVPRPPIDNTSSEGCIVKYSQDGNAKWNVRIQGQGTTTVWGTATDSMDNVYAVGSITTTTAANIATFFNADGSIGGTYAMRIGSGTDAFIVKYNTAGRFQWAASVSGPSVSCTAYSVAIDTSGNAYVVGAGGAAVLTAYNANGTAFGTTLASAGGGDAFIVKYNSSGTVQWVARVASTATDIAYGIAVDSSGNAYVTGQGGSAVTITAYSSNGAAFGTTLANSGLNDVFTVKYNSSGTVQWVARVASSAADVGYAAAVDSSGNVYITGGAGAATTTAFNSNGTAFSPTLASAGLGDAFLVKYNTTGSVQWVARIASTAGDIGYGIAVDSGGNVFVTGAQGAATLTAFNFNGTAFATTLTSRGSGDTFLVEYNTTGSVQWIAQVGGTGSESGRAVSLDSAGNPYIILNTAAALSTVYNSNGSSFGTVAYSGTLNTVVVKYNSSGNAQWAARIPMATSYGITSYSTSSVYIGGQINSSGRTTPLYGPAISVFQTLPTTKATGTDAIVAKYDVNGQPLWGARLSSGNLSNEAGYGTATDSVGNIYVTGIYGGGGATGTAPGCTAYNADGTAFGTSVIWEGASGSVSDVFLVKYNPVGVVQWLTRMSTGTGGGSDIGYAVAVDSGDNVYVTGEYIGVLTAYNSDGTAFGTTLATIGTRDVFFIKYNSSGIVQWAVRAGCTGNSTADRGHSISIDTNDNIYLAGLMDRTNTVFTAYNSDGSAFGTTLPGSTTLSLFLLKYNTSGTAQWIARINPTSTTAFTPAEGGYSVATDSSGNVYVSGNSASASVVTAYSANGSPFGTTLPNAGLLDGFVAKYNSSGSVQWIARIASTANDYARAVAVDRSTGDVYVAGYTAATTTYYNANGTTTVPTTPASGGNDGFLAKYNTNGVVQWARAIPGAAGSTSDNVYALAVDRRGNAYVGGLLNQSIGVGFVGTMRAAGVYSVIQYDKYGIARWVQRIQGEGAISGSPLPVTTWGLAVDRDCNVVLTGASPGSGRATILYNHSFRIYRHVQQSIGNDSYVIKYSDTGFPQWAARTSGRSLNARTNIASDPSGNSYTIVSGATTGNPITVYNANGTVFGSTTNNGAVLVKYNSSGTAQWFATFTMDITQSQSGTAHNVVTDTSGNVYVMGKGGAVTYYNADGSTFGTTPTGAGVGIAKYDANGTVQWVARFGTSVGDFPIGLFTDSSGNVYITGFYGAATATSYSANGSAFSPTLPSAGLSDAFIVKYNTNGSVQWNARIAGTADDKLFAGVVDSNGDVIVTGVGSQGSGVSATAYNANGTAVGSVTNSGLGDAILVKYNSSGTVQWRAGVRSTGADIGYAVAVDSSNNIYLGGTSDGAAALVAQGAAGQSSITLTVGALGFIAKFNSSGSAQAITLCPSGVVRIVLDTSGDIWAAMGYTVGTSVLQNADRSFFGAPAVTPGNTNFPGLLVKYSGSTLSPIFAIPFNPSAIRGFTLDPWNNIYISYGQTIYYSPVPLNREI